MKHPLLLLSLSLVVAGCGSTPAAMTLTSPAFTEGGSIPTLYTCEGENTLPPLAISHVPKGAKALAITMYDPDVPKALRPSGVFDHWVLMNIPADTQALTKESTVGVPGTNGTGKTGYVGPCPPAQYEPKEHRYIFTLYALPAPLELTDTTRPSVDAAAEKVALAKAVLTGRYQKVNTESSSSSSSVTSSIVSSAQ